MIAPNVYPTAGTCKECPANSTSHTNRSVVGLDSCYCAPGASSYQLPSPPSLAFLLPTTVVTTSATAAAISEYKPCAQCASGKYRPGEASFNCSGDLQGCPCGVPPLGATSGTISLTSADYGVYQTCGWMIHGGSGVTLHIKSVDIEDGYDFLVIYGCTSPSCHDATEISRLSGRRSYLEQEASYYWPNYLKLMFVTDGSVLGNGFEAEFRVHTPDSCTTCPPHSDVSLLGSNSVYECKCPPDFPGPDGGPCLLCRECECHSTCAMCKCDEICSECRCRPGFELDYPRLDVRPGGAFEPQSLTQGCPVPQQCICETFTAYQGTFTDGSNTWASGSSPGIIPTVDTIRYSANSNCRWMIAPPPVPWIRLSVHPGSQVLMSDTLTFNECDDITCSTKRTIGVFNGIVPRADGKASCDMTFPSCADGTATVEARARHLLKYDVEYTSSTGFVEVLFRSASLITPFSLGFNVSYVSGPLMCHDCVAGKYKEQGVGTTLNLRHTQCAPCPPNTISPPGSFSIAQCVCNIGFYYDTSQFLCVACVAGKTTQLINGQQSCIDCQRNFYAPTSASVSCLACPPNTQAEAGSIMCACTPGYTSTNTQPPASTAQPPMCSACSVGSYKSTAGSAHCTLCLIGKYSSVHAASSSETCSQCPSNMATSNPGSHLLTNCICLAGYQISTAQIQLNVGCVPCEAGSYKALPGMQSCLECVGGSYSAIGATECRACGAFSFSLPGSPTCGCFKVYI